MELDVDAARAAVQQVADAMGLESVEQAAEGILAIVNENMAGALRLVSVQRGHDPRDFALVAYGGAGPLHANALAELMGSFPVIVPPAPGLLCAIGDLVADFRDEFAQTHIRLLDDASGDEVAEILDGLGGRATAWLEGEGIPEGAQRVAYTADMRYHRQGYEIPVALEPERGAERTVSPTWTSASTSCTSSCTGSACPAPPRRSSTCARSATAPCRSRSCRPASSAPRMRPARSSTSTRSSSTASASRRRSTTARSSSRGPRFDGPAIVTEFDSTTVVLPGYRAAVDSNFNILITPND